MIRVAGHDDAPSTRVHRGDAQREVVGLRTGARVHDLIDLLGQGRQQPIRVGDDALVQIASVGVEGLQLPGHRTDDAG